MEVVLLDTEALRKGTLQPESLVPLAAFSLEPRWSPDRRALAFTRIDSKEQGQRLLSLYWPRLGRRDDVAAMAANYWSGYGFAPAWRPDGKALAFKLRSDRQRGVFGFWSEEGRVVQILPDPASQIEELAWGEQGLFFTVRIPGAPPQIRWLALPGADELATKDPMDLMAQAVKLASGFLPRPAKDGLYFIQPRTKEPGFDLYLHRLGGQAPELVQANVGPYFDLGPDGTLAFQSDPAGTGRPVRLSLRRPGDATPQVTSVSAYRFCFSPQGRWMAGLWISAGVPRYFLYDRKSGQSIDVAALRSDLSAKALAELVDRPLFDW